MASDTTRVNIGWHQDRNYWDIWEEGSELLTTWVAVSDVGSDCGPIRFVEGSHQWGYLDSQSDFHGQDIDRIKSETRVPPGKLWVEAPALMQAGGLSLHHNLTIHGSSANTSGRPRCSFAAHLRTDKNRPIERERKGLVRFIDDESICPIIHSS